MPLKATGPATEYREIDRWDDGVGWIAHPGETMRRASHALAVDGEVWVVDPVDAAGLDDLLAEFGEVAGVVVLFERHTRDAEAVADRHDVPVYAPRWLPQIDDQIDGRVELVAGELAGTGYELHRTVDVPFWHEAALYSAERGVLVVGDAVGTADYFLTGGERLGVHPMLRITPPSRLRRFAPERVLCGHGAGVHEDATAALADALDGSRSRAPALYAKAARRFLPL